MDLGVAGDPSLEGVWKCISSSGVEIRTHHSLEDQSGCSRMVQNAWLWPNTEGA